MKSVQARPNVKYFCYCLNVQLLSCYVAYTHSIGVKKTFKMYKKRLKTQKRDKNKNVCER